MAIKEYKLKDISIVKNGTKNKVDQNENGKYNFYVRSKNILKANDYTIDGKYIIIPGEGIFYPLWNEGKAAVHQRVYYIKANEEFVLSKYLYYWWLKNAYILYKQSVGTTVKSLRLNNFLEPKINLPNLQTQQEIINIIEPFENQKNKLEEKIKKLIELTNLQINNMKFYDYELSYFSHFQGFSFSSNDFAKDGKYKIFKIANITNLEQNIDTTNKLKSEVLLKTSNVVTGLSGSIGTSSIIIHDDIFQLNQRLIAIKTEYPLLIKLVIEKNKKILESLSTGSVQMNITKNDILNLKYDSSLNNNLNYIISKLYIIYSKKIYLINSIIHKLIELYVT